MAQALAANQLYDQMWLYYNFFQPVLHITEKTLVVNEGQRPHVKRHYDTASTPFDRLCATNMLPGERQQELEQLRQQTNPRHLHRQVHTLLDYVLALPPADTPQDVHETLAALANPVPWLRSRQMANEAAA